MPSAHNSHDDAPVESANEPGLQRIPATEPVADQLPGGTVAHEEMVDMLGITWLLSGTAFGHVLGAGAILGMGCVVTNSVEAAGVLVGVPARRRADLERRHTHCHK